MRRRCVHSPRSLFNLAALLATALAGCGTTRSTDTGRTATEQLLISDAIDRAVHEPGGLGDAVATLADAEGLDAHAESIRLRQRSLAEDA